MDEAVPNLRDGYWHMITLTTNVTGGDGVLLFVDGQFEGQIPSIRKLPIPCVTVTLNRIHLAKEFGTALCINPTLYYNLVMLPISAQSLNDVNLQGRQSTAAFKK